MPVLEHAQSIVLEFEQQVLHKQHLHQNPYGAVAQLGERVVRNDEVVGSIPICSTIHCTQRDPEEELQLQVCSTQIIFMRCASLARH